MAISKIMRRAQRSAPAVREGSRILDFIRSANVRKRLVSAADSGSVPISSISSDLQELVGKNLAKLAPIKRFAGLCVRAVLEEEGFELVQTGVTVSKDPLFRTGSVYQRHETEEQEPSSDFAERLNEFLTDREAARLLKLLKRRLAGHKSALV
jgi:hypothetical protein